LHKTAASPQGGVIQAFEIVDATLVFVYDQLKSYARFSPVNAAVI
jgi:hypothetical protein